MSPNWRSRGSFLSFQRMGLSYLWKSFCQTFKIIRQIGWRNTLPFSRRRWSYPLVSFQLGASFEFWNRISRWQRCHSSWFCRNRCKLLLHASSYCTSFLRMRNHLRRSFCQSHSSHYSAILPCTHCLRWICRYLYHAFGRQPTHHHILLFPIAGLKV